MNIKFKVASLHPCEKEFKLLFLQVLKDYCERFNLDLKHEQYEITVCVVNYEENASSSGCTIHSPDDEEVQKILIQVRDPFVAGWESNLYVMMMFADILCHEYVHACQFMTGRNGFKIPKLKYDKEDLLEKYFFDSMEVEARCLAGFYANKYGEKLKYG